MWSVWSGTHQGEFMGIPATGRAVAVEAWTLDILRDGLLVESRILMDAMGMLTQLGALPGPDAPAPG
jgi:predicted ester cyclase